MPVNQVKSFKITGNFRNEKGSIHNIVQIIKAIKEQDAIEQIYQKLGSYHKVKRRNIKIQSVEEIKEE